MAAEKMLGSHLSPRMTLGEDRPVGPSHHRAAKETALSGHILHPPGWVPDPRTGGTAYWDGWRFTGDRRPPRRRFAAAARHTKAGAVSILFGVTFLTTGAKAVRRPELSIWAADEPPSELMSSLTRALDDANYAFSLEAFASMAIYLAIGAGLTAVGLYLLRGRGPTTKAVHQRLNRQYRSQFSGHHPATTASSSTDAKSSGRRFRTAVEWVALNLTDTGRAHKAFVRGDDEFAVTLRVDRAGYRRKVEQIEERGWKLIGERWNKKQKESTPNSDGTHTVTSTQTARFNFVRDRSFDE